MPLAGAAESARREQGKTPAANFAAGALGDWRIHLAAAVSAVLALVAIAKANGDRVESLQPTGNLPGT